MEAVWFKSVHHRAVLTGELPVAVYLGLGRREIADRCQQSFVVKPGHPFERGKFHRLFGFSMGLGDGSVRLCRGRCSFRRARYVPRAGFALVAIDLASHRWLDAGFGQTLAIANGNVLRPAIAMMNQRAVTLMLPRVERPLQGIEHKVRAHRAADAPADNASGKDVDDKGYVQPSLPG